MKTFETLLTAKQVLLYENNTFVAKENQAIGVNQGSIVYVGHHSPDLKSEQTFEFKEHLLLPGLVNAHTHLPMSLFRGLADNLPLMEWLENYIFPLEAKLVDEEFIKIGTELSLVELIRSGVTTFVDMYFFNKVIAQALDQSGLRGCVGVGIPSPEKMDWKQTITQLRKEYKSHPRVSIVLAPHAPYTLSSDQLQEIGDFSKENDIPLTIHVSESEWEQGEIQKKYGKTPVQYLHDLNITGSKSLFVHCVHVNDKDLKIMSQTKTAFCYSPESNMKLFNGIAPVTEALKQGVTVSLGTDGSASNNDLNLFQEMSTGVKLQALRYGDNSLTAQDMFKLVTIDGAQAVGLGEKIGILEKGRRADIIAVNLNQPQFHPPHNLVSHLVYSAKGSEVDFVMCEGQVIMENREIKTLDEARIYKDSLKIGQKIQNFVKKG